MVVNRDGWEVMPETKRNEEGVLKYAIEDLPDQRKNSNVNYLAEHHKNFVAAMEANDVSLLKCGIETGAVAAINAHMGNVAFKTGKKVYWDAEKGEFKNDRESNALIKAQYHNGWKLPS